jgi:hypothetical protein
MERNSPGALRAPGAFGASGTVLPTRSPSQRPAFTNAPSESAPLAVSVGVRIALKVRGPGYLVSGC